MNLNISYSLVYDEVEDILRRRYEDDFGMEFPRIDDDNDSIKIAFKLAEHLIPQSPILENIIDAIKEICWEHEKIDQLLMLKKNRISDEELNKLRRENDELRGRNLLYTIKEDIYSAFIKTAGQLIDRAEHDVINRLCKEEKERRL
jgi:hypothetical protein